MMRILVVGAGMAGAACAGRLSAAGHAVLVLDKGRSVGGRLAQRRVGEAQVDHGAQYLTATDPGFVAALAGWTAAGLAAPWPGAETGRGLRAFAGVPSMAAPVRQLLHGTEVRTGTTVLRLQRGDAGWSAEAADGTAHGPADAVVLAVPAPQAATLLLASGLDGLAGRIAGVTIAPCWSALLVPSVPAGPDWASRRLEGGPLVWAARNDRKPGRSPVESWTLHAGPDWSAAMLEEEPARIAPLLVEAFEEQCGARVPDPVHLSAHRWRYALVTRPLGEACQHEAELGIGLCGDWCLGPRVEAAWLSGTALAARLLS
ncbi:MAG: NAD(P)-binding protein [Geminicoccaceae bacterium]